MRMLFYSLVSMKSNSNSTNDDVFDLFRGPTKFSKTIHFSDDKDGTKYLFIRASKNLTVEDVQKEMFARKIFKSDIIIFNLGLHILHLIHHRNNPQWMNLPADDLLYFLNYQQRIESFVNKVHFTNLTNRFVAKSVNFLCYEKFPMSNKERRAYSESYRTLNPNFLSFCKKYVTNVTNIHDPFMIAKACYLGSFTNDGVNTMNIDLSQLVYNFQTQSDVDILFFPDYLTQSCNTTNDGIHHPKNALERARLLSHLLTTNKNQFF